MRLAPLQHFLLRVSARQTGIVQDEISSANWECQKIRPARQTGIYRAVDAANFDLVMKAFGRLVTTELRIFSDLPSMIFRDCGR